MTGERRPDPFDTMRRRDSNYRSFLVRLWREHGATRPGNAADGPVWRFSVEDPHTGERLGFNKLGGLVAFLQAQMNPGAENGAPPPEESELGSAPAPDQSQGGEA